MNEKKIRIAILRGGRYDHARSLKNGASAVLALSKHIDKVDISDVVIEKNGDWFEKGIPSDEYKVFSKVDYYLDFTHDNKSEYHSLAKKLDVKRVFENNIFRALNRLSIKRVLEQLNYNLPKYIVIRDDLNLENNLKDIWYKFHTPLIIREGNHIANEKSLLTYSFIEAFKRIKDILSKRNEVLIEEHVSGRYISVAAIPGYRDEDIYIPTPLEIIDYSAKTRIVQGKTLHDKSIMDHSHHKLSLIHIDNDIKKEIKDLVKNLYKNLPFDHHILVDICMIEKNGERIYKILEVHAEPQIFQDSRFHFILENSGVDLGSFILSNIEKIEEENKAY